MFRSDHHAERDGYFAHHAERDGYFERLPSLRDSKMNARAE